MRARTVVFGVLTLLALGSTPTVAAASHPSAGAIIIADLEGRPIKSDLISSYYCHDFDFPRVHCFGSGVALERSLRSGATDTQAVSVAYAAGDYVTIFDGSNYSGAYMDVSQSYDALFSIGWNDRISSYVGRNSVSGTFWTDWYSSGSGKNFCCNAAVSTLSGGLDNAFSSVYRH